MLVLVLVLAFCIGVGAGVLRFSSFASFPFQNECRAAMAASKKTSCRLH